MVIWRRRLLLWVLSATLLAGCGRPEPPLVIGAALPAVELERFEGGRLSLPAAFRDRVVLIHFWADWCARCRTELRDSEALHRRYREQGLAVLGINLQQSRELVGRYLQGLDISYPMLLDRDGQVARRYGVTALPLVYLVDRQGRLHARLLGGASAGQLERLIRALL